MSTPKFIVSHNDQQLGPYDEAELKAEWAKGTVLGVDYVYDEGKEDWIMVAERFRWAAAGALTETVRVTHKPALTDTVPVAVSLPEQTEEITIEAFLPPPAPPVKAAEPKAAAKAAPVVEATPAVVAVEKPAPIEPVGPAPGAALVITPEPIVVPTLVIPTLAIPAPAAPKGVVVEMSEGYGEVSIDDLDAGSHEIAMRGDDVPTGRFKLDVLPSEPVALRWNAPATCEVGQTLAIELRVLDARGLPCRHFDEELTVVIDEKRHSVRTIDGVGRFETTREQAGRSTVSAACASRPALNLPSAQTLEWTPGPAVQLVVDGPTEHQEGQPLKVRVKALDKYGNVARSYRGAVNLEIKAG